MKNKKSKQSDVKKETPKKEIPKKETQKKNEIISIKVEKINLSNEKHSEKDKEIKTEINIKNEKTISKKISGKSKNIL